MKHSSPEEAKLDLNWKKPMKSTEMPRGVGMNFMEFSRKNLMKSGMPSKTMNQ